ncbi:MULTISPECIES: serine/threonine-protein kinase [Actinomadura]|uniref:Serine/threonine-protein kinase n=1 Tax=Actinomadura yumaensis TaxID=111807 RepID=A0ABW2CD05_9ACTN|nr:serine/threonine-protein kinase [Actinomadura sp. J1-007]MWK33860.1 protein kinase [Actinomadura sp. J1-007]
MSTERWRLPGFIEDKELGSGAQGRVVLARHETSGYQVAIKYLAPELLNDAYARDTFRSEAALLKRVVNPFVAQFYSFMETPQGAAIILEAVPGTSLRTILDGRDEPFTPEAALATLKGSLVGLSAAHAAGVVHRDYKPANVLVQQNGQSKLIDFGVAVLTGQGGTGGTPSYMAPEQWNGQPSSPSTDIYAAACVFFECATGAKPYQGDTVEALRALHTTAPIPLHLLPEPLWPLLSRGLAKRQIDRYPDAGTFIAELEAIAVQSYGADWERRGAVVLAGIASALATAVPLVAIGSAMTAAPAATAVTGTAATGTAATAATGAAGTASQSALALGETTASTSKGVLVKVGGTKGVAGIGGTAVAATVAAGFLLWPSEQKVGGVDHGSVLVTFGRPGAWLNQPFMPASDTPYMGQDYTVRPARAKAGTRVTLVMKFKARSPGKAKYLPGGRRECFGEKSDRKDVIGYYHFAMGGSAPKGSKPNDGINEVSLYRSPPARIDELPWKGELSIPAKVKEENKKEPFIPSICAFLSTWTGTYTFTVPPKKVLRPGRYLITVAAPPHLTTLELDHADVPPEAAEARTVGSLPVFQVLSG